MKKVLGLGILFSLAFALTARAGDGLSAAKINVAEREIPLSESHLLFDGGLAANEIAITFGGPLNPDVLTPMLDLLKMEGLRAHFFITGISAWKNQDLVKRIVEEGHVLGSASYGKSMVTDEDTTFEMKSQKIEREITFGHEMVYSIMGEIAPFIRFQMRHGTLEARRFVKNNGIYAFYWNIDYEDDAPERTLAESLDREGNRGIVAISMTRNEGVRALVKLIDEIKARDLKVIVFQPPKSSDWKETPPIIRAEVRESVRERGGAIKRRLREQPEI